jgi:pimeloyl-ACP methyl ester carboxylesterase
VDHIEQMLNALNIDRAIMCGVSFAASSRSDLPRRPERTSALILVSTPGLLEPGAPPAFFTRFPWLTVFAGMPRARRDRSCHTRFARARGSAGTGPHA